jgi:16S rRNA (guanine527-N7)-methyltransferase
LSIAAPPIRTPALDSLDDAVRGRLTALVELLCSERAPSSIRDPEQAWRVHVADSLSGIEPGGLATATRIADVGAGAGLPGLVLAAALPEARIDLIEATGRKCEFIAEAARRVGLDNAAVVCERSETWAAGEGRERYDAVTARAVGRLATLAELASPLLEQGGTLVCWKGRRDEAEEQEMLRAAPRVAMDSGEITAVGPYAGSRHRHIHRLRKNGPTPEGLPRRAGIAKKRPFGSEPSSQLTNRDQTKR